MEDCRMPPAMGSSTSPKLTEKLAREKVKLEERLAEVNNALEILSKNPEVAEALDAVSKLRL